MTIAKRPGLLSLLAAALLTVALALVACGDGEPRAADQADDGAGDGIETSLNGAGATFPEPLYLEWIGEFTHLVEPGVRMNYQGIGSGGGIEQFTQGTVAFGASDAPMTDEEVQTAEEATGSEVLHIPTVFGAVVLAYNVEDVDELKLDADAVAGIFLGEITSWDDPAIAALNEGVELPDTPVQVVHRSDSSGTTDIFTGYMEQISERWASDVGAGKTVDWPVGLGGQGNDGVAAVVQQQNGSIGYVELSYALETGLSMADLENAAGNYAEPTLESTAAAGEGVDYPEDLRFSLSNSPAPQAYPIVGATWILAHGPMEDPAEAEALQAFLTWALTEGDAIAEELGYAPLPDNLQALAFEKVDAIGS